jgi:glutamyl-tRNA synthetase
VEDLDRPRTVPGSEARQLEDLAWLGLDWDEGPFHQSERTAFYEAALADLVDAGRTYACDCSRAEIARVASAPHAGEEVVYPGTCRDADPARRMRRDPAIRLRIEPTDTADFVDGVRGAVGGGLLQAGGDFVLRRADGVFAYQLAVAADDLAMGVTAIPRGDDLLASTPRQLLLMQLWRTRGRLPWAPQQGQPYPRYFHLPLVRAEDGSRLAKRTPRSTIRELRAEGVRPAAVVGRLAAALGLLPSPEELTSTELLARAPAGVPFSPEPWCAPRRWG